MKFCNSKKTSKKEILDVSRHCSEYHIFLGGNNQLLLQIVSYTEGVVLATDATSLFSLCFSYVLNKLSTNKRHLLAVFMTYVKIHSKNNVLDQKIYIPAEDKDVYCI